MRDEIKRRIEQRDRYSANSAIAITAIVAVAFSETGMERVLLAVPLVSLYFSILILYSYQIHGIWAKYLRDTLEPELARCCQVDVDIELETYYLSIHATPGIRKTYFIYSLWGVSLLAVAYLLLKELFFDSDLNSPELRAALAKVDWPFVTILILASLAYAAAGVVILRRFRG